MNPRRAAAETPLSGVDLVLADLDGVIYRGNDAIPFAVESIARAAEAAAVGYVTNNAARTAASVANHLRELGLSLDDDHVVTSPQAAVVLLAELVDPGATVLVIGGEGLTSVVEAAGFRVTHSAEDGPAAVIQGFAPSVGWRDLAEAAYALKAGPDGEGIPWVATNTDWTIPQARGTAPGNGTLVSAVHTAVGRLPVVAGKPEPAIFETAVARFAASVPLFIGDRLDTDVSGAKRSGIRSALVLTGIDGPKQILAADAKSRPDFVLEDLRQLHEPYPTVQRRTTRGGEQETRVGDAVVRLHGQGVRLHKAGGRQIDVLRAGAAAIWGAPHSIHLLEVDPRLYSAL